MEDEVFKFLFRGESYVHARIPSSQKGLKLSELLRGDVYYHQKGGSRANRELEQLVGSPAPSSLLV